MAKNIHEVLIAQQDLPSGFRFEDLTEVDNHGSARQSRNPDAELALMEQYGRITGYMKNFSKSPNAPNEEHIMSQVSLYKDASGAEFMANRWRRNLAVGMEDAGGKVLSIEEIQIPQLGDFSFGYRMRVLVEGVQFNVIAVDWRRANVRSSITWGSVSRGVFQNELMSLCRKQDSHLQSLFQAKHGDMSVQAILGVEVVSQSASTQKLDDDMRRDYAVQEPRHRWIWIGGIASVLMGLLFLLIGGWQGWLLGIASIAAGGATLWISRFGTKWRNLSTGDKAKVLPGVVFGFLVVISAIIAYYLWMWFGNRREA